jgi:signal transduction histidine kinase
LNPSPAPVPADPIAQNRLVTVARVLSATVHDVNNALQIIGGSAELLENQPALTEAGRRATSRIRAQAARAAELLEELSALAKSGGGGVARVSLRDVVNRALGFRALMIRRAGLTLAFDPVQAPAAIVLGRGGELLQAVINLLLDSEAALQAQQEGAITVQLTEESGAAVLRIDDNGAETAAPAAGGVAMERLVPELIARGHGGDLTVSGSSLGNSRVLRIPLAQSERG